MHDCNGTRLQKGDVVSINFVVDDIISTSEDYCNVTLKAAAPDGVPFDTSMNVTVTTNTKLATLVRRPPSAVVKEEAPPPAQ